MNQYNTDFRTQNPGKKIGDVIKNTKYKWISDFKMQNLVKLRIKLLIMLNILLLSNYKLTEKSFAARLKRGILVTKADFHNKVISLNRKIILNKTKYLEVEKKPNSLIIKN